MGKICPKCGYEKKEVDTAPDYECPMCGIIYDKFKNQNEDIIENEKVTDRNTQFHNKSKEVSKPETPLPLLILALFFVPGLYIVLLLSAVATIAIGASLMGIIYSICTEWLHRIPIGILFLLGLGILIGIAAVLKGIFQSLWTKPRFEPAILIDLNKEPLLTSFIKNLCGLMGTKPPNSVILHSEPSFFVQQGKLNIINGKAKGRVLSIGLPLLGSLTINELRAILSHEFAHFTGRDTLYSSFVLPVYIGTTTASGEMSAVIDSGSESESIVWMSIPLILPNLALNLYLKLFHFIDMKISRSREKRADTIAVLTCGSYSFSSGLRKVISVGKAFHTVSQKHIIEGLKEGKAFVNYYNVFHDMLPQLSDLVGDYENKALSESESIDDSHPALRSRLSYIPKIDERFDDETPATNLLANLEQYEQTLTENYTHLLGIMSGYYDREIEGGDAES